MVEHSAVNRVVVGSSPTRGAFLALTMLNGSRTVRPHGQAVKTSPFHGGNTGSIPVGVIIQFHCIAMLYGFYIVVVRLLYSYEYLIKYGDLAKW